MVFVHPSQFIMTLNLSWFRFKMKKNEKSIDTFQLWLDVSQSQIVKSTTRNKFGYIPDHARWKKFFEHLDKESARKNSILNDPKPMAPMKVEKKERYQHKKNCGNCGMEFDDDVHCRTTHHDHVSSKFIYAASNRCNLALRHRQAIRKSKREEGVYKIVVVLQNLSAYDLHLILENLLKSSKQANLGCLGPSSERLLTFSYRAFQFIDSCNFMKAALSTLCENLVQAGTVKFKHTRRHFESEEQFSLLLRKRSVSLFLFSIFFGTRGNAIATKIGISQ